MQKAQLLRTHLRTHIPFLSANPDRLVMYVEQAQIIPNYINTLSYEYRYTLTVGIEAFTGSPDAVNAAIIEFMQTHQRDLLQNRDLADTAIKMNAEILDAQNYDLMFEIHLRELVTVKLNPDGAGQNRYDIEHNPAPIDIDSRPARWAGVDDVVTGLTWSPEATAAFTNKEQP